MHRWILMLGKWVLAVGIWTMLSFIWGNHSVSPNVNFGRFFFGKPVVVQADENTHGLQWVENEDETITVTLYVKDELGGFDYGIAFSPEEVLVVEYGFTEEFKRHYSKQQGSVIDHYFSQGKRASKTAQYIVYGGMATKTALYDGGVCYVTVSLRGEQASFYGVKDSAKYDHANAIMAEQGDGILVKGKNGASQEDSWKDNSRGEDFLEEDAGKDEAGGEKTGDETSFMSNVESNVSKNSSLGKSREKEASSSHTSKQRDYTKSALDGKNVQVAKTGDEKEIVEYMLVAVAAAFVAMMMGKTLVSKNWGNPKET